MEGYTGCTRVKGIKGGCTVEYTRCTKVYMVYKVYKRIKGVQGIQGGTRVNRV